ncbi:hypothetical protein TWF569_008769 [Orbilia oligospora]|nr:hypothetical protein TWF569_008769 [Orbilia oligospora]
MAVEIVELIALRHGRLISGTRNLPGGYRVEAEAFDSKPILGEIIFSHLLHLLFQDHTTEEPQKLTMLENDHTSVVRQTSQTNVQHDTTGSKSAAQPAAPARALETPAYEAVKALCRKHKLHRWLAKHDLGKHFRHRIFVGKKRKGKPNINAGATAATSGQALEVACQRLLAKLDEIDVSSFFGKAAKER